MNKCMNIKCNNSCFKLHCTWIEFLFDVVVIFDIMKCNCGYYKNTNHEYYSYEEFNMLNEFTTH